VLAERGARAERSRGRSDEAALGRALHVEGCRIPLQDAVEDSRHAAALDVGLAARRRGDAERAHEERVEDEAGDGVDEGRGLGGQEGARSPDRPDLRLRLWVA
jgi:hypothetical protein